VHGAQVTAQARLEFPDKANRRLATESRCGFETCLMEGIGYSHEPQNQ